MERANLNQQSINFRGATLTVNDIIRSSTNLSIVRIVILTNCKSTEWVDIISLLLSKCPKLTTLVLNGSCIGDHACAELTRLSLTELHMDGCGLIEISANKLLKCISLKVLSIEENPQLPPELFSRLLRALRLKVLRFSRPDAVELNAPNLQQKYVGRLTGIIVSNLTNLQALYLSNCSINCEDISKLSQHLFRLKRLFIPLNNIGNEGLHALGRNLTNLEALGIESNHIEKLTLISLAKNLTKLSRINYKPKDPKGVRLRVYFQSLGGWQLVPTNALRSIIKKSR